MDNLYARDRKKADTIASGGDKGNKTIHCYLIRWTSQGQGYHYSGNERVSSVVAVIVVILCVKLPYSCKKSHLQ